MNWGILAYNSTEQNSNPSAHRFTTRKTQLWTWNEHRKTEHEHVRPITRPVATYIQVFPYLCTVSPWSRASYRWLEIRQESLYPVKMRFLHKMLGRKKRVRKFKKSSHPWINFTEFFIYFWAATKSNISNFKNPNYICQIGEISLFINILLAQIGNKVTHMNFGK